MSFRDLKLAGIYSAADDRLKGFYLPVLEEAVTYDRVTGYFRSSALVAAASGLVHFIRAGAKMRLIAGAELEAADMHALTDGESLPEVLARRLLDEQLKGVDIVSDHRLEVLAYMAREGMLEIKIGVPVARDGKPLARHESTRYFHSKYGILTDGEGNQVAFMGSDNESASGWAANHETFSVAKSWLPEVWSEQGEPICELFKEHWEGRPDRGWAVLDLPEAVRERLIGLAKKEPPVKADPEEAATKISSDMDETRLLFASVAPRISGGTGVGYATAGVEPWPHQLAIARRAVETYPRSYLLADEVGLGKTIEAGLALRELLVSGKASTVLLLVPASVIKQWQEELLEKFALDVPRYDGQSFWSAGGMELTAHGNPWKAFPVQLASSHLARRRDRREQLIEGAPWDVVLVDEAHHARRRGSKPTDTPNSLLSLLNTMRDAGAWRALYLASATPMQMHPHEAWDLLQLLGLHGLWSRDAGPFIHYYTELREPFDGRDWQLLARLSRDFFDDPAVHPDPALEVAIKGELGLAASTPVRMFAVNGLTSGAASSMPARTRDWLDRWLRSNTPMKDRVFRTTRNMLRQYKVDGILSPDTVIPRRVPRDRFIPMTAGEAELYRRIETYIVKWYDAYLAGSKDKKPLGFIMTIYRRRLTSSFEAIERSLRRRLAVLKSNGSATGLLDPDDMAALESEVFDDLALELKAKALGHEITELQDFIAALADRPPDESKMGYLHQELKDAFNGPHDTALIFTQYTDTMEYIRDQLVPVYGSRVACYSGRGGERWDPDSHAWTAIGKVELKNLFRTGEEVKILIGTDSLSEGLNLQTCAKLINYDMPWNFMRVEQRIGRVDRIGGRERVDISNYFYKDTVEEQIYQGIGEDFDWFEDVVGPAQPVLNQIERAIEDVAMEAPGEARDRDIAARVRQIKDQMREAQDQAVRVAEMEGAPPIEISPVEPAIDLLELETVLTRAPATADHLTKHPTILGAYLLGGHAEPATVTLRRAVLDEWAPSVKLLTYGTAELDHLFSLAKVPEVVLDASGGLPFGGRSIKRLEDLDDAQSDLPDGRRQTIAEQVGELPLDDRL